MSEKNRLIGVFARVKIATEDAAKDIVESRLSGIYSDKGMKNLEDDIRLKFNEAMQLHTADAMEIINARENEYRKYRIAKAKGYIKSDAQLALASNLELLRSGAMSRFDVEALVLVYNENDTAVSVIRKILAEQKSDLITLLNGRISSEMQIQAFENMRGIVKAGMNENTLDRAIKVMSFNRGKKVRTIDKVFFPGYNTLEKDVDDDLMLIDASSTLVTIGGGMIGADAVDLKRVSKETHPLAAPAAVQSEI